MSCPTCDHAMACLSLEPVTHWCPRCGTISQPNDNERGSQAPKLVERCRLYWHHEACKSPDKWVQAGIAESINTPEDRPA